MAITLPLDVEAAVSAFLRADADVTALVDDRVYTAKPANAIYPLARITRVGTGPIPTGPAFIAEEVDIQIDAFGGRKREANALAETIRIVLMRMLDQSWDGTAGYGAGWIFDVDNKASDYAEDTSEQPPRPRYIVQTTFRVRWGVS